MRSVPMFARLRHAAQMGTRLKMITRVCEGFCVLISYIDTQFT